MPYLDLTYEEKQNLVAQEVPNSNVQFIFDYSQNMSSFWRDVTISFGVFHILIFGIVGAKLYAFNKRNPRTFLESKKYVVQLIMHSVLYLLDYWSEIVFWFLYGTAAYWFFWYKAQVNVSIVLPSLDTWDENYSIFNAIFCTVFACRFLVIMFKIIK